MKALIIAVVMALCLTFANIAAADIHEIGFAWEQEGDLTALDKWTLNVLSGPGGQVVERLDIPYSGSQGTGPTFTAVRDFEVTGKQGDTIRLYFTCTAWSKNGTETAPSNEVMWEYTIPYKDIEFPPSNLTVTLVLRVILN